VKDVVTLEITDSTRIFE